MDRACRARQKITSGEGCTFGREPPRAKAARRPDREPRRKTQKAPLRPGEGSFMAQLWTGRRMTVDLLADVGEHTVSFALAAFGERG